MRVMGKISQRIALFVALFAGLFSVFNLSAVDNTALVKLKEIHQHSTFIMADFQQSRVVPFISKPLVSEGEFVFARNQGLVWQINQPFYAKQIYTEEGVYQSVGEKTEKIEADPMNKAIGAVLADLLSGKWVLLEEKFELTDSQTLDDGREQIILTAKDRLVAKVVAHLSITFTDTISAVQFTDSNDNTTTLMFYNQHYKTTPLTEAELAKFN